MLLGIDIGNTNIVCGAFRKDEIIARARLATDLRKTTDEYGGLLLNILAVRAEGDQKVNGIAISSVVPPLTPTFKDLAITYFNVDPLIVGPGIRTEMPIKYDDPRTVGADRIVNAVAASHIYPIPQIIIDSGTALTFCAVNANREYCGGAIFPGMKTSYQALARSAAQLSMIDFVPPRTAIGKSTEESLQSGAINGYVSVVEGMVARFKAELGGEATVIGTGGVVNVIAQRTDAIDYVDPDLTLKGLKILYNLNRP